MSLGALRNAELSAFQQWKPYDSATDTGSAKNERPVAKCWHATAVVGGKIYVISGGSGFATIYNSVEEYDPVSDLWRIRSLSC
jgi:hypothetical protein